MASCSARFFDNARFRQQSPPSEATAVAAAPNESAHVFAVVLLRACGHLKMLACAYLSM
jgi:hypothetical protein